MKAESRTLQRIFEQTIRYCVPLFQRPYVWDKSNNWKPLWEDIRRLAQQRLSGGGLHRNHFIGAIVLEQIGFLTGNIESREIIDGQQRLTTIQILLTVLKDICKELKLIQFEQRFLKFSRNDPAFIDHPEQSFKVWPTNPDRHSFQLTLESGNVEQLKASIGEMHANQQFVNDLFPKAYEYFTEVIQEWLKEVNETHSTEQAIESLWHVISSQLRLVTIDLEQEDDAQVIFETLNSRGADLLPADLVKNYLFRQAQDTGAPVEDLYQKYWKVFDEETSWRQELRQGRLKRPRLDLFLQHYLSLKTRDDVLVTHVFETYKQFAYNSGLSPELLVKDLYDYGKVFQRLISSHKDSRIALFLKRLAIIDTVTVYPFLLESFRRYDQAGNLSELHNICSALESFLIRRMICGLTTKNYNRIFLELLSYCENNNGVSYVSMRDFLKKSDGDSVRWPSDDEFRKSLTTSSLYKNLPRPKLRLLLMALDNELETGMSEAITLPNDLTIEHLLPQRWQEHWLIETEDQEQRESLISRREALIHTLGNLTLLTNKLNPGISNANWEKKHPKILHESKLNLNRALQKTILWNEDAIGLRGKTLAELALKIWPF